MMRPVPQYPARKSITNHDQRNHKRRHLQLVRGKIRHRVRTVTNSQIAHAKIAKQAGQSDRGGKSEEWRLKNACSKYKYLERRWRRQKRGDQHSTEPVALDPMANGMRALPGFAVKISLPAHARQ